MQKAPTGCGRGFRDEDARSEASAQFLLASTLRTSAQAPGMMSAAMAGLDEPADDEGQDAGLEDPRRT